MEINHKYIIEDFPLHLEVVEAFDFREEPILLLEKDKIGNNYLSYLAFSNEEYEQRIYLQISEERFGEIISHEMSLYEAFSTPENKFLYIVEYSMGYGNIKRAYLIPQNEFAYINPIQENYNVEINYTPRILADNAQELLAYSERKQKLIFDFYLQSENLLQNVKPYAIYKILTPIVEIIKSWLHFDNRNADKYLAFSNFRHGSLGVTIELNYSKDLFLQKETDVLEILIDLLNAQKKEDFEAIISKTDNDRYIKEYTSIIKAIIDNDAILQTSFANHISGSVITSQINKEKAEIARTIIDENFDAIEDVEEIIGTFLEIDIDIKEPSFKIFSKDDNFTLKGKFELSILEKVKNDYVNIGKEVYRFTIKTFYYPETTIKPEEIKRYMINYEKYV